MQAATKALVVDLLTIMQSDVTLRRSVRDAAERLMPTGAARTNLLELVGQGNKNVNGPAIGDNFAAVLADVSNDTPE